MERQIGKHGDQLMEVESKDQKPQLEPVLEVEKLKL
jgi:hypothetical protein